MACLSSFRATELLYFELLKFGFPHSQTFLKLLSVFFLVHLHNYSSTKSGLVKQQHFKKPQTLISRQSFPPTSSPFKQGCQPCCFFQTFSESPHQAACKYLNASINVKSKYESSNICCPMEFLLLIFLSFLEVQRT